MLGSRDEADDVVQEALLRAYLGLSQLRDAERFGSWLCGIAVNVAKMRLRARRLEVRAAAGAGSERADGGAADDRELLGLVQEAVASLPDGQRQVVLMHYVDDLSCAEIASLLGRSPGAVRVRLHRARAQLRAELAAFAPTSPTTLEEESTMVEMKLQDVLVRVAEDEPLRLVAEHRIVLLAEREGERVLPIWIGPAEGNALAFRLLDESPQRPFTHDLMVELLRATGAEVERVAVTALRDKVFFASISVGGEEIDARPSDALNLAVRVGAPIVVAEDMVAEAAVDPDGLAAKLDEESDWAGLELPPGEWRSLSAELLHTLHRMPR